MKKIFLSISSILILLVGLISCDKNLQEVASLELANEETIVFDAAGGQKAIRLTTNQTYWVASPNVGWLQVNQEDNSFTITSEPNPGTAARKGEVLVTAGEISKRILVEQASAEDVLFVSTDKVNSEQFENKVTITVKSLSGEWTVEEGLPNWISTVRVPGENKLTVIIKENTEKAARSHKLFIKSKSATREVLITQAGIMYYIFPYITPESSSEDVKAYEEARRSVIQIDAAYQYGGAHTYVTKSKIFRTVKYNFSNKNLFSAVLEAEDPQLIVAPEFIKMLEEDGYVFRGDNNVERVYVKETRKGLAYFDIVVNISYNPADKVNYKKVTFRIIRGQRTPHPTYKEIPLGLARFDVSTTDVTAWETTHGGKMSSTKSYEDENFSDYFYDVNQSPYVIRRYVFDNQDKLINMHIFLYDVNKMFYMAGENQYVLTREFRKLLKDSGFTEIQKYDDPAKQFDTFYKNPKRKIALAFRVGHYGEVNDGVPVAHILMVPIE